MIKRRRLLSILAGSAALPLLGANVRASTAPASWQEPASWKGIALGAQAQIILDHENGNELIEKAVAEIRRLENIFSLYLENSELAILNRDGKISNPSFEMLELLSLSSQINLKTGGAFDPSVQSLWALYATAYSEGKTVTMEQLARAKYVTGWQHVDYSSSSISFTRKGVALTLNGIAQGYIADKIRDLFKRNGVENVLVNTGEIASIGAAPSGKKWRVHLKGERNIDMPLSDGAIATSAPLGTSFDVNGKVGHILDPKSGKPSGNWQEVSVISKSAALADGLSTGFAIMSEKQISQAKGSAEVLLR